MLGQQALPLAAAILIAVTLVDWLRHGGGLTPRRRTWLFIAAVFLVVRFLVVRS